MNPTRIVDAVVALIDLVGRIVPKRKPKPPKFAPIKITPKRPLDPYEPKTPKAKP